jgi:hypothetical protein
MINATPNPKTEYKTKCIFPWWLTTDLGVDLPNVRNKSKHMTDIQQNIEIPEK